MKTIKVICQDCLNKFGEKDGRPYKYDRTIWLCNDCTVERMEEEQIYIKD